MSDIVCVYCFFFNDTATTEIYTLSLHDALLISRSGLLALQDHGKGCIAAFKDISIKHLRVGSGKGEQEE